MNGKMILLNSKSACGWVSEGEFAFKTDSSTVWIPFMQENIMLGHGIASFEAEQYGVK